jgi:pyocin large subunit-like protein
VPEPGDPRALNRYAYVYNNPLRYTDPSGHWLETLWDIASIAWDLYEIRKDPRNPWNWGALAVDVGVAILPFVPGGVGAVVHGGKAARAAVEAAGHANEVMDAARVVAEAVSHADEAIDALRAAERLSQAGISLERFRRVGRESIPSVLEAFGDAIRPMGDIPEAFRGRRVTTLGRT